MEQRQIDRARVIKHLCEGIENDPHILRGVYGKTILKRCGYWLRTGPICGAALPSPVQADLMYALSKPVARLDCFLSHSWHASAVFKTMALLQRFNGNAAVCAGMCAALATRLLEAIDMVPRLEAHAQSGSAVCLFGLSVSHFVTVTSWSVMAFLIFYSVTLLHWQRICASILHCFGVTAGIGNVFLDKLCIHQVNDRLKKAGIKAIGGILLKSDCMVVAWDATYFERVWCVFELAVFVSLRPSGLVDVVPIDLLSMEVFVITIVCVVALIRHLLFTLCIFIEFAATTATIMWLFMHYQITMIIFWCIRRHMRAHAALLCQLDEFSVTSSKCYDEKDRLYVQEIIRALYGSNGDFEYAVRTELKQLVESKFGKAIPRGMLVRTMIPFMVSSEDFLYSGFVGDADIFTQLTFIFVLPAFVRIMFLLAQVNLHTKSSREEVTMLLLLALFPLTVTTILSFFWRAVQGQQYQHYFSLALACLIWGIALVNKRHASVTAFELWKRRVTSDSSDDIRDVHSVSRSASHYSLSFASKDELSSCEDSSDDDGNA